MIEFFVYVPDRASFIAGMTTTYLPDGKPVCTLADDGVTLIPAAGISIDEIGPVVKAPAVVDEDGVVITPAQVVDGHHVNIRVVGEIADMLTVGMPTEGNVFERTRILQMVPGMVFAQSMNNGVPEGYVGPNGVRLFDPAVIATPYRVWL
jgi:hypothetical protein